MNANGPETVLSVEWNGNGTSPFLSPTVGMKITCMMYMYTGNYDNLLPRTKTGIQQIAYRWYTPRPDAGNY